MRTLKLGILVMCALLADCAQITAAESKTEAAVRQFEIGNNLLHGTNGVATDLLGAIEAFHFAAEGGHAEAQFRMGIIHRLGIGTGIDLHEAAHWFELAARAGHLASMEHARELYSRTNYVRSLNLEPRPRMAVDFKKAKHWDTVLKDGSPKVGLGANEHPFVRHWRPSNSPYGTLASAEFRKLMSAAEEGDASLCFHVGLSLQLLQTGDRPINGVGGLKPVRPPQVDIFARWRTIMKLQGEQRRKQYDIWMKQRREISERARAYSKAFAAWKAKNQMRFDPPWTMARRLLELGMAGGDTNSILQLTASAVSDPALVATNRSRLLAYCGELAEADNVHGSYLAGLLHLTGPAADVENVRQARVLLGRAAEQGHGAAAARLGRELYAGSQLNRDLPGAARYLAMAAATGRDHAAELLRRFAPFSGVSTNSQVVTGAQSEAEGDEVRIAIVSDGGIPAEISAMVQVVLSEADGFAVLERDEVEKIVRERTLNIANRGHQIDLAKLLNADALLLMQGVSLSGHRGVNARLLAVQQGVMVDARGARLPDESVLGWAENMAGLVTEAREKLAVKREDALALSVVGISTPLTGANADWVERQLSALLNWRLQQVSGVFVTERRDAGLLIREKGFSPDTNVTFWGGSYLIEGEFNREGSSITNVNLELRVKMPDSNEGPIRISGQAAVDELPQLVDSLVVELAERLGRREATRAWSPALESTRYLQEADWGLRWGNPYAALRAAVAAEALGNDSVHSVTVRLQCMENLLRPGFLPETEGIELALRGLHLMRRVAGRADCERDYVYAELGLRLLANASDLVNRIERTFGKDNKWSASLDGMRRDSVAVVRRLLATESGRTMRLDTRAAIAFAGMPKMRTSEEVARNFAKSWTTDSQSAQQLLESLFPPKTEEEKQAERMAAIKKWISTANSVAVARDLRKVVPTEGITVPQARELISELVKLKERVNYGFLIKSKIRKLQKLVPPPPKPAFDTMAAIAALEQIKGDADFEANRFLQIVPQGGLSQNEMEKLRPHVIALVERLKSEGSKSIVNWRLGFWPGSPAPAPQKAAVNESGTVKTIPDLKDIRVQLQRMRGRGRFSDRDFRRLVPEDGFTTEGARNLIGYLQEFSKAFDDPPEVLARIAQLRRITDPKWSPEQWHFKRLGRGNQLEVVNLEESGGRIKIVDRHATRLLMGTNSSRGFRAYQSTLARLTKTKEAEVSESYAESKGEDIVLDQFWVPPVHELRSKYWTYAAWEHAELHYRPGRFWFVGSCVAAEGGARTGVLAEVDIRDMGTRFHVLPEEFHGGRLTFENGQTRYHAGVSGGGLVFTSGKRVFVKSNEGVDTKWTELKLGLGGDVRLWSVAGRVYLTDATSIRLLLTDGKSFRLLVSTRRRPAENVVDRMEHLEIRAVGDGGAGTSLFAVQGKFFELNHESDAWREMLDAPKTIARFQGSRIYGVQHGKVHEWDRQSRRFKLRYDESGRLLPSHTGESFRREQLLYPTEDGRIIRVDGRLVVRSRNGATEIPDSANAGQLEIIDPVKKTKIVRSLRFSIPKTAIPLTGMVGRHGFSPAMTWTSVGGFLQVPRIGGLWMISPKSLGLPDPQRPSEFAINFAAGTGLPSNLTAAALARSGDRVLSADELAALESQSLEEIEKVAVTDPAAMYELARRLRKQTEPVAQSDVITGHFARAARGGIVNAQYELAKMGAQDGSAAEVYIQFEKIAEAGMPEAYEQAVDLILTGRVQRDIEVVEAMSRAALQQGQTKAMSRLVAHFVNHPDQRDLERAYVFMQEWSEADSSSALAYLENMFASGFWPGKEFAGARPWLKLGGDLGGRLCLYLLGVTLEKGMDGAVDYEKAMSAYQSVLDRGYGRAVSRIGMLLLDRWKRESREADLSAAIEWFERGVRENDVRSAMRLSELFEEGRYTEKTQVIAALVLATRAGVGSAAEKLEKLDSAAAAKARKTSNAPVRERSGIYGTWAGSLGSNAVIEVTIEPTHNGRATLHYRLSGKALPRDRVEVRECRVTVPGMNLGWVKLWFEKGGLMAFHQQSKRRAVLTKDGEDDLTLAPVMRLPGKWSGKWDGKWPIEIGLSAAKPGSPIMRGSYSYMERLSDEKMRTSQIRGVYRGSGALVVGGFHGISGMKLTPDAKNSDQLQVTLKEILPKAYAAKHGPFPKKTTLRRVKDTE